MEGNRDESERCIEIAAKALSEGKFGKARKFLMKAEKLYPSDRAKELLAEIKRTSRRSGSTTNQRRNAAPPKTHSKPSEPDYTSEQLEAVRRIKKCKDAYEILMVTKEATVSEIKKAYNKLALQLHPDKNKAPGSAEAFIALKNAQEIAIRNAPAKPKSRDTHGSDQSDYRYSDYSYSSNNDYYNDYHYSSNNPNSSNNYNSDYRYSSNNYNSDYSYSSNNHYYNDYRYSSNNHNSSNNYNSDYRYSSNKHDYKSDQNDTSDPASGLGFQDTIFKFVRFQYIPTDFQRFLRRLCPLKVLNGRKYFDRLNVILQRTGAIFNIVKNILSASKVL